MTNTNLLKSKMVAMGESACVDALADLLHISRPTASNKLNNKIPFTQDEIIEIVVKYRLTVNDVAAIFLNDERLSL